MRERGAAAVELSVVAIFLLILTFGVIDVGRALFTRIAVLEAAQEGAVYAAFEDESGGVPLSGADIEQRVIAAVDDPTLTTDDVDVACRVDTSGSRDSYEIEVTVTYTIDMITPLVGDWMGPITLSKHALSPRYIASCPTGVTVVTS
jgi:Flp pilus assembly protein TadG